MTLPKRPLLLLASRGDHDPACWWWRCGEREYERMDDSGLRLIVPAHTLRPVAADFSRDAGDPAAIAEVWKARDEAGL